jgi:hypothetical protein
MKYLGQNNPYKGLEKNFQQSVIRYLKLIGLFAVSVPNGGRRDVREAVSLKKQGVVSGCPDILVFDLNLAIELKVKRNKPTENQIEFMEKLDKCGWACVVAWNMEELISYLEELRKLTKF